MLPIFRAVRGVDEAPVGMNGNFRTALAVGHHAQQRDGLNGPRRSGAGARLENRQRRIEFPEEEEMPARRVKCRLPRAVPDGSATRPIGSAVISPVAGSRR